MTKTRSPEELYEASKHVEYELTQLNDCMRRLATQWLQVHDGLLYNSLLTAFTIYARNIYFFLYARTPRDTDIVAAGYFDDPEFWKSASPASTPLLEEMAKEVDKRSAHLTYHRTAAEYWWKWVYMHDDLRAAMRVFVANVLPDRIVPELLNFEQRWTWRDNRPEPPA
jgi:hypothetical protein